MSPRTVDCSRRSRRRTPAMRSALYQLEISPIILPYVSNGGKHIASEALASMHGSDLINI